MARTSITQERLRSIRAIAFDVDGVLTDGGTWWGADGSELKRFSFADIMGVSLARRSGLIITLISGENSPLVDRYAAKMSIEDFTKGCRDKASALREFAERHHLNLKEICFMGDDVNDLPAMEICGLSAAPGNARQIVRETVDFLAKAPGGEGAVRELIDTLLTARGTSPEAVFRSSL